MIGAIAHNSLIIEDDYDCEHLPGDAPRAIAALSRGREHVIYINTFGRTLFPSLRLGYLVAPPELVDALREARRLIGGDTTTPNQLVLCDFLTGGHFARHMRKSREAFALRRQTLMEELTRSVSAPLSFVNPAPTSHVCLNLPQDVDDVALAQRAADIGVHVGPVEPLRRRSEQVARADPRFCTASATRDRGRRCPLCAVAEIEPHHVLSAYEDPAQWIIKEANLPENVALT